MTTACGKANVKDGKHPAKNYKKRQSSKKCRHHAANRTAEDLTLVGLANMWYTLQ